MKLRIHHIILIIPAFFFHAVIAQDTSMVFPPRVTTTTVNNPETNPFPADSVSLRPVDTTKNKMRPIKEIPESKLFQLQFYENPFFGFNSKLRQAIIVERNWDGKEHWFYTLVGLLFMVGLFRQGFEKYLHDLFRLFFNTTMKQRQIREQLIQTPLAAALLNLFFVLSGSFYITFLLQHFNVIDTGEFWIILLYAIFSLTLIYLAKFIWLKAAGWLFNLQEAADNYIFIVFIINKIIGIFLLPILVLMAFTSVEILDIGLAISWIGLAGLFFYRFILTFAAVRNQINVNLFHFFLYLCAFEIAPLLLIYKGLLIFFERS